MNPILIAYLVGALAASALLIVAARREWWNGELTGDGAFSAGMAVLFGAAVWPLVAALVLIVGLGKAVTPSRRRR